jgi:Uma2 family endonuclease
VIALWKPVGMTLDEFLAWQPPELADHRWQLIEGEPVCMASPSENHGAIIAEATFLLTAHLRARRPGCRVIAGPGVVPRMRSAINARVPDLGVTCAPPRGEHMIGEPVLLIEVLSPSKAAITRSNVWTYATIPSVAEILLLASTRIEAELLRRDAAGAWPEAPEVITAEGELQLASIGFRATLRELYATTSLAG